MLLFLFELAVTDAPSPPPSWDGSLHIPLFCFPETGSSLGWGLNDFLAFCSVAEVLQSRIIIHVII